jgi:tetratricopeptide (TPR) repeat protein
MMIHRVSCALVVALFLLVSPAEAEGDYYSKGNLYKFAEHLYEEGDYLRAAGEYRRCLAVSDSLLQRSVLGLRIAAAYRLGGHPDRAIPFLLQVRTENPDHALEDRAEYEIGRCLFEQGKYLETTRFVEAGLAGRPSADQRVALTEVGVLADLFRRDWRRARHGVDSIRPPLNDAGEALAWSELERHVRSAEDLDYKKPWLAATLSSLVPGAGKVYAGRSGDGIYSFLLVGICAWQAAAGFEEDGNDSVKGWIYGGLGSFFYLGNVYGSAVAVRMYNRRTEDRVLQSVDLSLIWRGQ